MRRPPQRGTAAGKTGTAQTGQFAAGKELKNYWFAGFYPVRNPRYTIVVLQDGQTGPSRTSAAIFAQVCDALDAAGGVKFNFACNFTRSMILYTCICMVDLKFFDKSKERFIHVCH